MDINYYNKYLKYKKKYLNLKNGGSLRSSTNIEKKQTDILKSRSTGDKSFIECGNIDSVDAITFEPIISLPSNRLIRLDSGKCTDVMNFLYLQPNSNASGNDVYSDPSTRQVFSTELIKEVNRRLVSLNQDVPAWITNYDGQPIIDNGNDSDSGSDSEYEYYSDDEDINEGESKGYIGIELRNNAKKDINTSPYRIVEDIIRQAEIQVSGINTILPIFLINLEDRNNQSKYYNAIIINILFKLIKFNKTEIDDNKAKKLAFLLYLAIRPTIYGADDQHPAFKFISDNFAQSSLDFSIVFDNIKNKNIQTINQLIDGIFPQDEIPLGVLLDVEKYKTFMMYDNTTNSYRYYTMEELVQSSKEQ